jgi:hypothetical protein
VAGSCIGPAACDPRRRGRAAARLFAQRLLEHFGRDRRQDAGLPPCESQRNVPGQRSINHASPKERMARTRKPQFDGMSEL